jgi:hypothetical protein
MAAKYILAVLSCAFLIAGLVRLARDAGRSHPQSRTWLLIGVIFGAVSAWLFYRA